MTTEMLRSQIYSITVPHNVELTLVQLIKPVDSYDVKPMLLQPCMATAMILDALLSIVIDKFQFVFGGNHYQSHYHQRTNKATYMGPSVCQLKVGYVIPLKPLKGLGSIIAYREQLCTWCTILASISKA